MQVFARSSVSYLQGLVKLPTQQAHIAEQLYMERRQDAEEYVVNCSEPKDPIIVHCMAAEGCDRQRPGAMCGAHAALAWVQAACATL